MSHGSIKCVIVGDGGVGKTCMLVSYATNKFPTDHIPTVFDNYAVTINVADSIYFLQLFDTAGQEEYDRLRLLAYPSTDVFLVCFSTVRPQSYRNVVETWMPELKTHCPRAPRILVGTQIDLRDDFSTLNRLSATGQKPVSFDQGMKMARKLGASSYVECSALTQQGLKNVFDTAMLSVLEPTDVKKEKSVKKRMSKAFCFGSR